MSAQNKLEVNDVPDALLKNLDAYARSKGATRNEVVLEILESEMKYRTPSKATTFAEIFAPVHEHTLESGETEEEIGAFIDAEIKAHRAEQRAAREAANGS